MHVRQRHATAARALATRAWLGILALGGSALADEPPVGPLPDTVRPTAYELDLVIDPDQSQFSGRAAIDLVVERAVPGFWIHGLDLTAHRVVLHRGDRATLEGRFEARLDTGVGWVDFDETLDPGPARLVIDYDAPLSDHLAGLFRTEQGGDHYALAKSESIQARRAFPGFDEPRFKTPFTISITTSDGDLAISNAPLVETRELGGGRVLYQFAPTRPLPTFLLAFAVGPFDVVEAGVIPPNAVRRRPIPLRGIARRGKGAGLGFVLGLTPQFLAILEETLQTPYPYAKLDIVAAPDWPSGATELAGAITYREPLIVLDGEPPPARRRRLASVHAHELAHMWFGDLVTPPWWDDLWLKESFSEWAEPIVLGRWDPDGSADLDARASAFRAMDADSLASGRSVREPVGRNEDIRNAYDSSVYSKGPAIIEMVEAYLGADRFRRTLRRYLEAHADGVVGSESFFELVGDLSGDPEITRSFRDFITRPGVPLIAVDVDCDGETPRLRLRQQRYRALGSEVDPRAVLAVPLVLSFGASDQTDTRRLILDQAHAELPLSGECPTWVLPNAGGLGYYRFAVSVDSWAALAARFPELDPREALAVVDSAMAGFEAGGVSTETLLAMVEAAAAYPSRQVVVAPFRLLADLERYALRPPLRAGFRSYLQTLYAPRQAELAQATEPEELLLRTDLRTMLALTARDPEVRGELSRRAGAFLGLSGDPDPAALDADEYLLALAVAVEDLGRPAFERLRAARAEIDDAFFREASIEAMGAVADRQLAEAALAYALAEERPASETARLVRKLAANEHHSDWLWSWVQAHLPTFLDRIPAQWRRTAPALAGSSCSRSRIGELDALFAVHGDLAPGHEQTLARTREALALCAALVAAQHAQLERTLTARMTSGQEGS